MSQFKRSIKILCIALFLGAFFVTARLGGKCVNSSSPYADIRITTAKKRVQEFQTTESTEDTEFFRSVSSVLKVIILNR